MGGDKTIDPALAEGRRWAAEHSEFLRQCFAHFQETHAWPTADQLQHRLTESDRDDVDVAALARTMPDAIGIVRQQKLVLRVRALIEVPAAAPLLGLWCAALQTACERWLVDSEGARLTHADVLDLAQGDRGRTRLASELLLRESWAFGDGYGGAADENWSREVRSQSRVARDVRNASELIAKRDQIEFPPIPEPPRPSAMERVRAGLRRIANHSLGSAVLAGLLVALIIWLVSSFDDLFSATGKSEPDPVTPPPRLRAEDAATPDAKDPVSERVWSRGARTFSDPYALTGEGPRVGHNEDVLVDCKIYWPHPESVQDDGYWYRLLTPPWEGLYSPANSYWNGDRPGERPYTHRVDWAVRTC